MAEGTEGAEDAKDAGKASDAAQEPGKDGTKGTPDWEKAADGYKTERDGWKAKYEDVNGQLEKLQRLNECTKASPRSTRYRAQTSSLPNVPRLLWLLPGLVFELL